MISIFILFSSVQSTSAHFIIVLTIALCETGKYHHCILDGKLRLRQDGLSKSHLESLWQKLDPDYGLPGFIYLLCISGTFLSHPDLPFYIASQLLSCLEKKGLDTEGILRVSGSQTRIKV